MDELPVEPEYVTEPSIAQLCRAPCNRVENRLDIRPGASDHAEDLGRRCLLLQRLAQLAGEGSDLLFVTVTGSVRSRRTARRLYCSTDRKSTRLNSSHIP